MFHSSKYFKVGNLYKICGLAESGSALPIERLKKKTREELLWPYFLRLLLKEPGYAYELRKKTKERFEWEPPMTTSYTVLYRLERGDYIRGKWRKEGSRPKKYYKITESGKEILKEAEEYLKDLQGKLFEDRNRAG